MILERTRTVVLHLLTVLQHPGLTSRTRTEQSFFYVYIQKQATVSQEARLSAVARQPELAMLLVKTTALLKAFK